MFTNTATEESNLLLLNMNTRTNMNTKSAAATLKKSLKKHQQVVGELVLDNFVKQESPALAELALCNANISPNSAYQEIDSAIVDAFFSSSTENTPMFAFEALESNPKNWTPLFDNDIAVTAEDVNSASTAIESIADSQESLINNVAAIVMPTATTAFLPTPAIEDSKISTSLNKVSKPTSTSLNSKVDHLGIVSYNRKQRAAPLTPIIPESDDPVSVKRARNTEAARRSRARKVERMNQLEDKVEQLLLRNAELEEEVKRLNGLLSQK
ncbi:hypothetical protein TPHA_0L00680 [Tetrapisispora phaffii CBS 4417]|uniref:BZIP domain-containing protein n=1 Tax=Tetrapisispora phaffii (strain ATCC 24235 / CBS 4417 / NBRC 1672 / NRRL Y-8282 / UCD 70-5) TaxID=1071381 RepID=G8BZU6_TETPH|nr:hypothetical protein TPHA_0L00680 [Tetrapisispora phaffii CBS 4417]CCE65424.1 hypothetical protein TPHA_0L00680 [Tetrapisispora phaffii CBS 4417]